MYVLIQILCSRYKCIIKLFEIVLQNSKFHFYFVQIDTYFFLYLFLIMYLITLKDYLIK